MAIYLPLFWHSKVGWLLFRNMVMQRKGEKEGTEVYKNGGIRSDVRAGNKAVWKFMHLFRIIHIVYIVPTTQK